MQNIDEIWKPVVGFEGHYEVSNVGRVRSLDRIVPRGNFTVTKRGKILAIQTDSDGYAVVGIYGPEWKGQKKVHALVAAAFIGPRPELHVVDHANGVRNDNRAENIRYASMTHNARRRHVVVSSSGYLGVFKNGTGWTAHARVNRKNIYLGTYKTPEEASSVRLRFDQETNFRGL